MPAMCYPVKSRPVTQLTEEELLAVGELLAGVWPRPDRGPVERAQQLRDVAQAYDGPAELAPESSVVWDGDKVIAHALTFARTIKTGSGDATILALSKVASDPTYRGKGLGASVVGAAFGRVDAGLFPYALFQTSNTVRPFYERIGCREVENRIANSWNAEDPTSSPFWDEVVMRYPAEGEGPDGPIDLQGPGY